MLILNLKGIVFLLFLCLVVSCSDKSNDTSELNKDVEVKQQAIDLKKEQVEKKPEQKPGAETKVDIMKPLDGKDPCFMAVELLRTEGDVTMFKDLGDSIIVNSAEAATDSHRTYMGIIGARLKESKSIPEIRQELLDTCRLLKKK